MSEEQVNYTKEVTGGGITTTTFASNLIAGSSLKSNDFIEKTVQLPIKKTYTSFGGADMILFYKDQTTGVTKTLGELQAFNYHEILERPRNSAWTLAGDSDQDTVYGDLVITVFDDTNFKPRGLTTLTLVYLNEFGQAFFREIEDVVFTNVSSTSSIDDISFTLKYDFRSASAKGVETVNYSSITDNRRWKEIVKYARDHTDDFYDPYKATFRMFIERALQDGKLTAEDVL
jgi:hypothetical protein